MDDVPSPQEITPTPESPLSSHGPSPRPRAISVKVRPARLRDVPGLVRLYRGQPAHSRRFFHPYPFDRPRLFALLALMVLSQRFVRGMIRYLPNYAFVLLVAAEPGEPPLGFGSIRMVSRPGSAPWAKFGFMVAESQQGKGIGTRIARGMYERAVELGVRTGGGTMLVDNGPSRALAERFGFPLTISTESDPRAPEGPVLRSVADLNEVLAHGPFPGSVPVPTGPGLPTELSSTAFDRPVQPPTTHEAPSE